jgi:hypothetical protein
VLTGERGGKRSQWQVAETVIVEFVPRLLPGVGRVDAEFPERVCHEEPIPRVRRTAVHQHAKTRAREKQCR